MESSMHKQKRALLAVAMMTIAVACLAAKPMVYPAKGQSTEKQSKDDGECYVWAKNNSGYDPVNPPAPVAAAAVATAPKTAHPQGGILKGAGAGAAVGAIGGNDVGEAAVKGAVIGGVAQRARRRGQNEAAAAPAAQPPAQPQQSSQPTSDTYLRAYTACMSGRGYTVN
jgi:hypothetical protein